MTDSDYAAGQLRAIRSLMERATIYRSISAPTAFVGGLLSLGGFAAACFTRADFLALWLTVLALTGLTNAIFLWRDSTRRGEPFFSTGMKLAARSLAPAFVSAGLFSLVFPDPISRAVFWILFYGIGLLSTQHFAPRSLVVLGFTFFLAGCGLAAAWKPLLSSSAPSAVVASGIMAATFGGFHLIYALAVWALGEERRQAQSGTAHV
jgi:hypothetical protein